RIAAATRAAVADGADEIDVVAPWRRFLAGDAAFFTEVLAACRAACGEGVRLKVILESGAFDDAGALRAAADLALVAGADFLKTSTGKREPGATLDAMGVFYDAIRAAGRARDVRAGVKASGGVRTAEQAQAYLAQADARMGPNWAAPATFRFGASALLDGLLAVAGRGD
ncbi:MAG TPA: deoxyribose-phosphate aldolase, partial [Azospirillaceae bacterium]|nr:deoxyribose-phosphate aldolase [Azospirillaceae bacterium]